MASFEKAIEKTLEHEGVYSNDPKDSGGETYKGISRKNWPQWLGWIIVDHLKKEGTLLKTPVTSNEIEIDNQLQYEVRSFYRHNFWDKIGAGQITSQKIAESIFDFAVNSGVSTSVKIAQQVVGSYPDGIFGKNTLAKINIFDPTLFVAVFALKKIDRYCDIVDKNPTQIKFLKGWIRRTLKTIS